MGIGEKQEIIIVDENNKIIFENSLVELLQRHRPDLTKVEVLEICNYLNKLWDYDVKNRYNINQCIKDPFLFITP